MAKKRSPITRVLWRASRTLAVAYVLVLVFLYVFQRRLQYFPDSSDVSLPEGKRYRDLEQFSITAADGVKLQGWYWPGERSVVLLVFHGNGGNREHRLEWLEGFHSLGLGVCMVDYRGYGGSSGSPTEEGLYLDAAATRTWLEARTRKKVAYLGESLGCGVAVELARTATPAALILQAGFSSAADVGQRTYPFVPVRLLMKDPYDNLSKIGEINAPMLFVHGEDDRIIPIRFARKLYDKAPEPKQWHAVPGAHHNDLPWVSNREYLARIDDFLRHHVETDD